MMLFFHIWCGGTGRTATFGAQSIMKGNQKKYFSEKNGSRAAFRAARELRFVDGVCGEVDQARATVMMAMW